MEIRDFTHADFACYQELSQEFFSTEAVLHPLPLKNYEVTFQACLEGSPYVRGIMLWEKDRAVGFGLLALTYSNEVAGLVVLLEELYIRPEYQGRGFGKQFLNWVKLEYPQAKRFRLEVTEQNGGAIRLYERMGYQPLHYLQMVLDTEADHAV